MPNPFDCSINRLHSVLCSLCIISVNGNFFVADLLDPVLSAADQTATDPEHWIIIISGGGDRHVMKTSSK